MSAYIIIALGSAIGGLLRYITSNIVGNHWGNSFPYDLLIINSLGSILIGFIAFLPGSEGKFAISPEIRQFIMIGICGGYTTFSSFSLKTLSLFEAGHIFTAGVFIIGSVILSLLSVWGGMQLANMLAR